MYNIEDKYSIWDLLKIAVILFLLYISFPVISNAYWILL